MDTVKGSSKRGKCLLTLLFRKSRFMPVILITSCTQKAVINALNALQDSISHRVYRKYFHVILTDNGSEFKNRRDMESDDDGRPGSFAAFRQKNTGRS